MDIRNGIFLRHQERVSICVSRKDKLILTLNLKKHVHLHVFLDGFIDCTCLSALDEGNGVVLKLMSLFHRFVETHFSPEERKPEITSDFVRSLIRYIFVRKIPEIYVMLCVLLFRISFRLILTKLIDRLKPTCK